MVKWHRMRIFLTGQLKERADGRGGKSSEAVSASAPFDSVFLRDQGNLISGTDLNSP